MCVCVCASPLPLASNCTPPPVGAFATLEIVCVAIFTFEYLARLFTCHASPDWGEGGALLRMCRYVRHPLNMIDVVAILPSYLEWAELTAGGGFAVLRILRLARVFRIFKIAKFNADLQVMYVCMYVGLRVKGYRVIGL